MAKKARVFCERWLLALAVLLAALGPVRAGQATPLDFDLPDGHFYTQANGQGGAGGLGYAIIDADGIPFWSEFRRLGGVDTLGYPISHRFVWKGTTVQALQKAVIQWLPPFRQVAFVNVFDELHLADQDGWLLQRRSIPVPRRLAGEDRLSWEEVARRRLALLSPYPALEARYFAAADPLALFGLPVSGVEDMGSHYALRLQRAAMQEWKTDVPWARAGEVTVVNGGDLAREVGLFPPEAVTPGPPPPVPDQVVETPRRGVSTNAMPTRPPEPALAPGTPSPAPVPRSDASPRVVVLDAGHGGSEVGAAQAFADGYVLREKDVNLQVVRGAAAMLREAGYEVILTRPTDAGTNPEGRDVNGDGQVNVDDDLQTRVDLANRAGAAVLVSVHHNGHPSSDQQGTEVYYDAGRPHTPQSRRLAELILAALTTRLREAGYVPQTRGVKLDVSARGREFYLLGPSGTSRGITRPSQMPAALGEGLFLSHAADAAALRRPEIVEAEARAYAAAIAEFLR